MANSTRPRFYIPATLNHIPDQVHTAYSPDGNNWYFGDTDGMFYNNGTAKLTGSDGTLSIKGFGTATYALHALRSATDTENNGANVISLVSPPAPGNNVINYGTLVGSSLSSSAMRDFYLLSSANNGVFDSLYVTTTQCRPKIRSYQWNLDRVGSTGVSGAMGIAVSRNAGSGTTIYVSADSNFATLQKNHRFCPIQFEHGRFASNDSLYGAAGKPIDGSIIGAGSRAIILYSCHIGRCGRFNRLHSSWHDAQN